MEGARERVLMEKGKKGMMETLGKPRERRWLGQGRETSCEGRGRDAGGGELCVAKAGEKVNGRWKGRGLCVRVIGVHGVRTPGFLGSSDPPRGLCWAAGTVQMPET